MGAVAWYLRSAAVAAALCLAPGAAALGVSADPALAPAGTYRTDKAHTRIVWQISHFGTSIYSGWFSRFDISFSFDPNAPEKSTLEASIDPRSVFTLDPAFDEEIAGPRFFDAARFPAMVFRSTSAARTGETTGILTGDLTFHGVTLPVSFDVSFHGGMQSPVKNAYVLGFRAQTTLRRSAFGVDTFVDLGLGDEVTVIIDGEFDHQEP